MTQDEIRLSIINYITYIKSNSLIEMEDICKYYGDDIDIQNYIWEHLDDLQIDLNIHNTSLKNV